MKCLRCHQDNPSQAKFCLECGTPADGVASSHADLKAELEGLKSSLGEALEQQTATAEILRVIGSSPTDVQPVFDTIVRSAARLCGGVWSMVFRVDGDMLDVASAFPGHATAVDTSRRLCRMRIGDPTLPMWRTPSGRAMREQIVVQTSDVLSEPDMTEDGWLLPGS